jgi:hypothetical protein
MTSSGLLFRKYQGGRAEVSVPFGTLRVIRDALGRPWACPGAARRPCPAAVGSSKSIPGLPPSLSWILFPLLLFSCGSFCPSHPQWPYFCALCSPGWWLPPMALRAHLGSRRGRLSLEPCALAPRPALYASPSSPRAPPPLCDGAEVFVCVRMHCS